MTGSFVGSGGALPLRPNSFMIAAVNDSNRSYDRAPGSDDAAEAEHGDHAKRLALEVRDLRMVCAVERAGTLTRASADMHVSQSALSHQLLKLERELGTQLFDRVGKRMTMTAAGRTLLQVSKSVLQALTDVERDLRNDQSRIPLRVAASCFTYYSWLSGALARFSALQPLLDVSIALESTRREIDALLEDEVDFVVTSGAPADERLAKIRLFSLDVVAVLSPDSRLASAGSVRWSDLQSQKILVHDLPDADMSQLRKAVGAKRAGQIVRVQLTEAIAELARTGQGVGLVTRWPMQSGLFDGLRVLPLQPSYCREFVGVWRRSNPRALPMRELSSTLVECMAETSPRMTRSARRS